MLFKKIISEDLKGVQCVVSQFGKIAQFWEPLSLFQTVIEFWFYFEKIPRQFQQVMTVKA